MKIASFFKKVLMKIAKNVEKVLMKNAKFKLTITVFSEIMLV